jgi:hypothetical protein
MKFTLVWTDKEMKELTEIWLQSLNRQAVTDAAKQIDRALEENPLSERHEIVNRFGTAIRAPVGVDFGVIL